MESQEMGGDDITQGERRKVVLPKRFEAVSDVQLLGGFPLLELPEELQLLIAAHVVSSPRDRAALCVAVPPLGRKAIKAIPAYTGPLMSLGNRVLSGGALSEAEVRRYVREFAPSEAEHWSIALNECAQLNAIAAPSARVRCVAHPHPRWSNHLQWRLESGALLRSWDLFTRVPNHMYTRGTPGMHHYEGAAGAERLVYLALNHGEGHSFVGERGAEIEAKSGEEEEEEKEAQTNKRKRFGPPSLLGMYARLAFPRPGYDRGS